MTNKTKIISISVVAVLLLGTFGSVLAYNQACTTPEAEMIREAVQTGNPQDPAIKAKLAGLPVLEKIEARICALRNLSPKEVAAIVAKKQTMAGNTISPGTRPLPPVVLGVQNAISPTFLGRSLMLGINSWVGYVDGKLIVVTGTAKTDNPLQGMLFIMNDFTPVGSQRISTLTATGPLKIVSEANGILVLRSVAGIYEAYDANTNTRHDVTAKGGTTYIFNLRTRTFR